MTLNRYKVTAAMVQELHEPPILHRTQFLPCPAAAAAE